MSVDDVDEDAAVLLDRRRLHDRPQGVCRASAAADDLAVVVLGDRELEHDRAVVFFELLDGHLVGMVDQLAHQRFEQFAHVRAYRAEGSLPCVLSSLRTCGVGCAPFASHARTRSSSSLIDEGCVCGLYCPTVSMNRPSRGER